MNPAVGRHTHLNRYTHASKSPRSAVPPVGASREALRPGVELEEVRGATGALLSLHFPEPHKPPAVHFLPEPRDLGEPSICLTRAFLTVPGSISLRPWSEEAKTLRVEAVATKRFSLWECARRQRLPFAFVELLPVDTQGKRHPGDRSN